MRITAEKWTKILRVALLSVLLIFTFKCFSLLLKQHFALVNHPYQVEMREGASLHITKGLAEGINPYLLENQPWFADNFGVMYPIFSLPFTQWFGMNLFSMRLASALAIFLCMILLFLALMRQRAGIIFSFAGVVIFYGCALYYVTPICRADALGMLFFMISIILPVLFRFQSLALLVGALSAIFAFYTKQYGILGFPVILSYVFLFVSMRKAIIQGVLFFLLLALSMWMVSLKYPCYFYNTTASMAFANNNNFAYSWMQVQLLFTRYLPGLSILALGTIVIALLLHRGKIGAEVRKRFLINSKTLESGVFVGPVDPYVFVFLVFFLFLLLKLGGNEGTFMTYHFQLLAFSWIIVVITFSSKLKGLPWLQVPTLAYTMFTATTLITSTGLFKQENKVGWEKAIGLIKEHKNILNDQTLATEMIYADRKLYNSGLTDYFFRSTVNEQFNESFPFTSKLIERGNEFKSLVRTNIREQQFDVLLLADHNWIVSGFPVNDYYMITDSIHLNMYHTYQDWMIYVWKPRSDTIPLGESVQ